MRILIIDNYDSFTFNLYQQIAAAAGAEPTVVANDAVSVQHISALDPDAIVLSPGPGRPERAQDFGVCAQVVQEAHAPVLGVCLGYQGIGYYHGARVVHAPQPVHGRLSRIRHNGSALFRSIPQEFAVVRYHSLVLDPALPDALQALAWTGDGTLMALRHRTRPLWGIQFHPESICTEFGDRLIRNFLDMAAAHRRASGHLVGPGSMTDSTPRRRARAAPLYHERPSEFDVFVRELPFAVDPETAFLHLYAHNDNAFWLGNDRAVAETSRFTYMGSADGPHSRVVTYDVATRRLTLATQQGCSEREQSIFDYLNQELAAKRCPADALPFDFNCGFVGYFGYELKAECGGRLVHASSIPDAALIFSDRLLAFDHHRGTVYAVALARPSEAGACEAWFDRIEETLADLPEPPAPEPICTEAGALSLRLSRSRDTYLQDITRCLHEIGEGESYEICLTNQLHTQPVARPLDYYRVLRRLNTAPYAAYLRFGELAVLSSSPEQFIRVDRERRVSTRPIKGTVARHPDPGRDQALRAGMAENEKYRSENLIVVDLLRNDLGRVCEVGSVQVPSLMEVESYATVHQLVSTVCGRLKPERTAVDCLRAAFPGGSMTGAPKKRTLEIIDRLETEARGVYSGSIGFLALNGSAELNIVIRTAVCTPAGTSIGIGGAITALSDPEEEFAETLLKARALVDALIGAGRPPHPAAGDTPRGLSGLPGACRREGGAVPGLPFD